MSQTVSCTNWTLLSYAHPQTLGTRYSFTVIMVIIILMNEQKIYFTLFQKQLQEQQAKQDEEKKQAEEKAKAEEEQRKAQEIAAAGESATAESAPTAGAGSQEQTVQGNQQDCIVKILPHLKGRGMGCA